jgi:hypothetical protein
MSEIENGNQEATAPAGNSVDDILATFDLEFGSESQTPSQGTPSSEGSSSETQGENSEPSSPASDTSSESSGSTGSESPDSSGSTSSTATSPVESTSTTQEGAAGQQAGSNGNSTAAPASSDAELRTLMMQILQNQQNLQNQKEPKGKPNKGEPEEDEDTKVFAERKPQDYTYNISPKLYAGLFGQDATEEERIACLQAFASGISMTVHNNILKSLGSWTKEQFQAIPRAVDYLVSRREKETSSRNTIREDFFKTFPELNKPELTPIIRSTIQGVAQETGAKVWNTQVKNLVGQRVKQLLAAYAQSAGFVPSPAKNPPALTPASPAPAKTTTPDPNSTDAILDVLNFDF